MLVGDLWYKFVRRPWTTSSNSFVANTLYLSWSKVRIENCVVTQMVFQNFKNIFQARTCLKDPGFFKQRYFRIIAVEVWEYNSFKDNFKVFLMLRLSKTSKNYPIKYLTTFEAIYFVLGLQKVLPNTNHNLYQKPITVEIKEELSHSKTAGT